MTKETSANWRPELMDLAGLVGDFIQYWGFKRIHGQIWALIFLSETPIDATTLTQRLGVSKALVSLAIKDLLQYKVIEVCGKGQKRMVYFRSNSDLNSVITSVLEMREKVMLAKVAKSLAKLKDLSGKGTAKGLSDDRLNDLDHMVSTARELLDVLIRAKLEPELECD